MITKNTDAGGLANPDSTAGGVAFLNVFGKPWFQSRTSPAFVYYNNVGGAANIAETVSHESGHNFGLSHDGKANYEYYSGHGKGETSWAPIMGHPGGKNVTHWSKGEYYEANNPQDDLAILEAKLGLVADTTPQSAATAAPIIGTTSGSISSGSDKNTYRFSTSSRAAVLISPTKLTETAGGNLDVKAEIMDAAESVVLTLDPAASTGINATVTLSPGTYFLRISNSGCGSPLTPSPTGYTTYDSLGPYTVTVVADPYPYAAWAQTYGDRSDPLTDGERNGILNIQRYAFGIEPRSTNQHEKLPKVGTVQTSNQNTYLTTTFRRNPAAMASYTVQESKNLSTWSDLNLIQTTVATSSNNDGTENVTVRSNTRCSLPSLWRFLQRRNMTGQ